MQTVVRHAKKRISQRVNKKRIKIVNKKEWWDLYMKYYDHKITYSKYGENGKEVNSITMNIPKSTAINPVTSKLPDKKPNTINKNSNDFLPPLQCLKINEDFRLWSKEGQRELLNERKNFCSIRDSILNYIHDSKKLINLSKATLVCNVNDCGSHIVSIHCMKQCDQNNKTYLLTGYALVNKLEKDNDLCKHVTYYLSLPYLINLIRIYTFKNLNTQGTQV